MLLQNMLTTVLYQPETPQVARVVGRIKLADFGVSLYCGEREEGDLILDTQGTNLFEAPESFSGEPYSGYLSDIWALGITLYALNFQTLPFFAEIPAELQSEILAGEYVVPPFAPGGTPDSLLSDLLAQMLETDPGERASLATIQEHPYLKGQMPAVSGGSVGRRRQSSMTKSLITTDASGTISVADNSPQNSPKHTIRSTSTPPI